MLLSHTYEELKLGNELKFIEALSDGVIITGHRSDGILPDILYANPAMCRMTGYLEDELIGKQPSILAGMETNLDELNRISVCLQKGISGEFEIINYKKNGTSFWSHFQIIPIRDVEGHISHWMSVAKDITQQYKTKLRNKENEDKFKSLLENSGIGIKIIIENKYLYVNNTFSEMTGYSPNELYQLPFSAIIHPSQLQSHCDSVKKILSGEINFHQQELRIICKDKTEKIITVQNSRTIHNGQVAIIGTAMDMTEIIQYRESLVKFKRAVEQSEASIVMTNVNGDIEYVNPAFLKVTGYTNEEALGQNPRILKSGITEKSTHDLLWDNITHGQSWKGRFCNKKKNGELYWEQAVISPVLNDNGEITNYIAVKEDITHRVNLESEREKLIEELTISLNELKQFSYITSHNLRAPLTNLIGIVDLLEDMDIPDETIKTLLEGFKRSTHKLNDTLQDLIKTVVLRDKNSNELTQVSFSEILNDVKHNLNLQIKNSQAQIHSDFSQINGGLFNKAYILSIFQNLISNAIKFCIPNTNPEISIHSEKTENGLKLIFTDKGLGIDLDKNGHKIFGLYQRFHRSADSKGMGLFLVKSHVTAMGGEIQIESKLNEGSTFTIQFQQY